MRYLVAVDYWFDDVPGGAARVAIDVARIMRDRGHEVAVLCLRAGSGRDAPPVSRHDGMTIVRYDKPSLPGWHPGTIGRNLAAAGDAARRWLGDAAWDVVHVHTPFTGAGVMQAFGDASRYVVTLHSPTVLEQQINWGDQGWVGKLKLMFGQGVLLRLERRILDTAGAIHVLSQFTKSQIEHFHGPSEKVTVVPYWARPDLVREMSRAEARQRLGWPADAKIFFSVRQLRSRYGLDNAIEAVAPLAAAGRCRLYLAGEGPLRGTLESMAARLGVAERVRLLGRVSDEQLKLAYQAADLFLVPTRALECFGLIILEAMSFGCPVLSTDAAAIPEIMRGILPEFIAPAGDVGALREKMAAFLDGRLVPPPEDKLVEYVATKYGPSETCEKLAELLEQVGTGCATMS